MSNRKRFAGCGCMLALVLIASLLPLGTPAQAATPSTLSIRDGYKIERDTGVNVLEFIVDRSGNLDGTTVVTFTTQAGGDPAATVGDACTAGIDHVRTSSTLEFFSGLPFRFVRIPICDDDRNEQNEVFRVVLGGVKNGTIVRSTAVGTILDDDPGKLNALDNSDLERAEALRFTIVLSRPYPDPVSVRWVTRSGSAVAGSDYQPRTGTADFPAGTTNVSFDIPLIKDGVRETDERFFVDLLGPVGAPIATPPIWAGGGTAIMTILANDT